MKRQSLYGLTATGFHRRLVFYIAYRLAIADLAVAVAVNSIVAHFRGFANSGFTSNQRPVVWAIPLCSE
jgi:hypothetical protein